jgi:hypothetical protein
MKFLTALYVLLFFPALFVFCEPEISYTPATEPGGIVLLGIEEKFFYREGEAFLETLDGEILTSCKGFHYVDAKIGKSAMVFILGVHTWICPGEYVVRYGVQGIEEITDSLPVTVGPRGFLSEDIPLNKNLTGLMTEPDPQIQIDADEMIGTLQTFDKSAVYNLQVHQLPVLEFITSSFFGDRRRFLYTDGSIGYSIHTGIDMAAPEGTAVYASASGKVIMAKHRVITGNTILIEHLPGVFGAYFHLEKIAVVRGEYVEKGQFIAAMGTTGLSTASHLHWELRAGNVAIDPELVLKAPLLDKELIFGND